MLHGVSTLRSTRAASLGVCLWSLGLALAGGAAAQLPGSDLPPPPGAEATPLADDPPPAPPAAPTPIAAPGSAPSTGDVARTAMVIDAGTRGIDPRVGQHVTLVMRDALAALGYAVSSGEETLAAAQRARMPFPPGPADLWRVTLSSGVDRTVFARVWADSGRYVYEITVASADGTGPFFARGSSGADDLYTVVDRLTREAVPPQGSWDAAAAARYRAPTTAPAPSPFADQLAAPVPRPPGQATPFLRPVTPAEQRAAEAPGRRLQLALYTVSAIGADGNGFYNHLIELSFGVRLRRNITLSLQVGYANLNGRDGRQSNLLPMVVFERRLRLGSHLDLSIPIKGAVGFLPFNGPVLRVSAGLAYAIGERFEITADLLSPSFWLIDDDIFVSMNVALGVIVRL